ncbi:TPA: hypothetical protein JDD40_003417 [Salmonella enterica subsp. diarizonae]|nr:hypothetical protein [Salmonella enterica subsp. diarizonae]
MNVIAFLNDSWLFDDHFKGITGPIIVAIALWSIRSIRRLLFPFIWIFNNNLSSCFLKLSADDKINALKLISEYKETDDKYDILMKELKLKQYGLFYPLPILKTLFNYISDKDIRMNSTGFLSFLDCNQIFDYDRNTMPTLSSKKMIFHVIGYSGFIAFLVYYIAGIFKVIASLYHASANTSNAITMLSMVIIVVITFRIIYIILENFISFFWAVSFSKKLGRYHWLTKINELNDKYKS